jgi:hypothetical protein
VLALLAVCVYMWACVHACACVDERACVRVIFCACVRVCVRSCGACLACVRVICARRGDFSPATAFVSFPLRFALTALSPPPRPHYGVQALARRREASSWAAQQKWQEPGARAQQEPGAPTHPADARLWRWPSGQGEGQSYA